jgi:hypothetical protein
LTAAKKKARALEQEFVVKLAVARDQLSREDEQALVLRIARTDLSDTLDAYVGQHRRRVVGVLESWWEKYAVTLNVIEADRDSATASLSSFLRSLGYE